MSFSLKLLSIASSVTSLSILAMLIYTVPKALIRSVFLSTPSTGVSIFTFPLVIPENNTFSWYNSCIIGSVISPISLCLIFVRADFNTAGLVSIPTMLSSLFTVFQTKGSSSRFNLCSVDRLVNLLLRSSVSSSPFLTFSLLISLSLPYILSSSIGSPIS